LFSDIDEWNKSRKDLMSLLKDYLTNPNFMGFGAPLRTPTYILGIYLFYLCYYFIK